MVVLLLTRALSLLVSISTLLLCWASLLPNLPQCSNTVRSQLYKDLVLSISRGYQLFDFMLLQALNRYEPLFWHFANTEGVHPESLYRILLQAEESYPPCALHHEPLGY